MSTDQQSPSFGSFATGATSAHHFVTPTSWLFAPIAQRMDVALGASDTIRCVVRGCLRPMPPDSIGSHLASQFASSAVRLFLCARGILALTAIAPLCSTAQTKSCSGSAILQEDSCALQ